MSETPRRTDAERDARALIDRIRLEHSPEGYPKLDVLISNAMEILSNELYDTSTHFLLELLQNADDNEYASSCPTLSFAYKHGSLRVDCNEKGFEARNVEAICTIGGSTKCDRDEANGHTGEKGIGFKSIFKIADVVWISSRDFHFKFDRNVKFGIVAPKWAEFPEPLEPGHTSFYLQLSKKTDEAQLAHGLRVFDPALLAFLRRIRQINLQVAANDSQLWTRQIRRQDVCSNNGLITVLNLGHTELRYFIVKYCVSRLPDERKRPGVTRSDIILAFPMPDGTGEPMFGSQSVYARLPIGDHGLKFLLHGDFILTANRLHIDTSLAWNTALCGEMTAAFKQAVDQFSDGPMKYFWPFFMPSDDVSALFKPATDCLRLQLAANAILESYDCTMARPSELTYVDPARFVAHEDGKPFTLCPRTTGRYLSPNYPKWTIDAICSLGCLKLSASDFLEDLEHMICYDSNAFRGKSSHWHAQLAKALTPLTLEYEHDTALRELCIIPLANGDWTSASNEPVLFPKGFEKSESLDCSALLVVDPVAAADDDRRNFFRSLGIELVDSSQLCSYIADLHSSSAFRAERWTRTQLVSQVKYLYKSRWTPPAGTDLWFVTSKNKICKGSELYIPRNSDKDSLGKRILDQLQKQFPVIHQDYLTNPDDCYLISAEDCFLTTVENGNLRSVPDKTNRGTEGYKALIDEIRWSDFEACLKSSSSLYFDLQDSQLPAIPVSKNISNLHLFATPYRCMWSNNRDDWTNFLVDNMNLAKIPRLVTEGLEGSLRWADIQSSAKSRSSSKKSYRLSPEFKYLFRECCVSDVLQLICDNWNHYAQWIESDCSPLTETGTGKEQSEQAERSQDSRFRLIKAIGDTVVQTRNGNSPLRSTILPSLDSFADESIAMPVLDHQLPEDKLVRQRLNYFGVLVESDATYYIACLKAMRRQESSEALILSYVYEQIQSRYDGNEELIEHAFKDNDIIFAPGSVSGFWVNLDCWLKTKIYLEHIYPTAQRLFRCLLATGGVSIDTLITKASSLDRTSKLPEILELLTEISRALSGMTASKAASSVKMLRHEAIFPVKAKRGRRPYDELRSPDNCSWYVADRPHLRKSFESQVPLLAVSAQRLTTIDGLITALRLDSRRLSRLVKCQLKPSGMLRMSGSAIHFLRARASFIAVLISLSNSKRDELIDQIQSVVAFTADEVVQTYTMQHEHGEIAGRPEKGQIAMSVKNKVLQIFFDEESIASERPAVELAELFAEHCGIDDVVCTRLLYLVFSESNLAKLRARFAKHGFHIIVPRKDMGTTKTGKGFVSRSGDLLGDSSSLLDLDNAQSSDDSEALTGGTGLRRRQKHQRDKGLDERSPDRRIPTLHIVDLDIELASQPKTVYPVGQELDPSRNLEYIGQLLTARVLEKYLQNAYNSTKHWTSGLRARAGLKSFKDAQDTSPFTLADSDSSAGVIELLARHGDPTVTRLRGLYPTFHFEIAISSHGKKGTFAWSSSQLERIKRCRLPAQSGADIRDVMILVRICNAYGKPQFQLFVDPWDLFASRRVKIQQGYAFTATMDGDSLVHPPRAYLNPRIRTASSKDVEIDCAVLWKPPKGYSYRPLSGEQIRLFTLFPGGPRDDLHGSITTMPLSDAGQYRTLSYVWGEDNQPIRILTTPNGSLLLRASLYSVLLRLRRERHAIILWVDAICINQANGKEKIQQIRLLPRIFQGATCTLAILGVDDESHAAIEALLQIRAQQLFGTNPADWPPEVTPCPLSWQGQGLPPRDDPIWRDFERLLDRIWFRQWNDIFSAVLRVERESQKSGENSASSGPFLTLARLRELEARHERLSLFELLEHFRHVKSSWKRDRFFALLGLASDGNEADFEPDYGASFEQIVRRFASAILGILGKQGIAVQMLYRAGLGSQPSRFPSWIPDWTVEKPSSLHQSHKRGVTYAASKTLEEKIKRIPGTDELSVEGLLVDEIEQVSNCQNTSTGYRRYFREVDEMVDSLSSNYTTTQRRRLKWEVPIAGALYPESTMSGDLDLHESYEAFRELLGKEASSKRAGRSKNATASDDFTPDSIKSKSSAYVSSLAGKLDGWRFVITKKLKLCGIVPNNAVAGDTVAVISGGDVPFLLRPTADRPQAYRLVGECYVSGIMNGEALNFDKAQMRTLRVH